MIINIVTIFPEIFKSFLSEAILEKAIKNNSLTVNFINPRDYTENKHKKIDDYVFGGSEGMLMTPQPLFSAIEDNQLQTTHKIYMSPQGATLNQNKLISLLKINEITIIAGRYEGIDQRFINEHVDEQISIGDYILFGGEIPAMVLIEGLTRLLPNVLNNPASHQFDSFSNSLLEADHYTRPQDFRGLKVPEILANGNHELIRI